MKGKKPLKVTKANKIRLFISLITISVICLSCNQREVYYTFRDIKDVEWSKRDTLVFNIDSSSIEANAVYNVFIEVLSNGNYPYRNIWFYTQDNFNDTIFESDSKQYMLADEFGKWHGSGFGAIYQLSLEYKEAVRIKEKRNYTVKIVHGMRDEPLEGIEKIGLKLEKAFY